MLEFRQKATVEAALWTDTPDNREAFSAWFDEHDMEFMTRGDVIEVECNSCGDQLDIYPGQWVVINPKDGHISATSARRFNAVFEAAT